jgi:hypothetical protein
MSICWATSQEVTDLCVGTQKSFTNLRGPNQTWVPKVDDLMATYTFLLATWVTFEVQSDSDDVKLDLPVNM